MEIEIPLTPQQILQNQINDLSLKIQQLQNIKEDFSNAVDDKITGVSFLYKGGIITLKSYLKNTSIYTPLVNDFLTKINPIIDEEIKQHNASLQDLNNKLTELNQPSQPAT